MVLITESYHEIAQHHDQYVWYQGWQAHLWLPNPVIALGRYHTDPVDEGASARQSQQLADDSGKVE